MAGKTEWEDICGQADICALSGAAAFFAGVPGAVIVLNGPLWCYFYAKRYLERANPASQVNTRFICAQLDADSVVYGTEEYLLETLVSLKEEHPAQVFIINSCAIGLIGDDIAGIAAEANLNCPVIHLDGGGLKGGFSAGYRAAAAAYFKAQVLKKKAPVKPDTVNLLGLTFGYYNAENDYQELKRLLNLAGYKVLAAPGMGASPEEIAALTGAALNIVVHEELGLDLARYLQNEYQMPYLTELPPYGFEGTLLWLSKIIAQTAAAPSRTQAAYLESTARQTDLKAALQEVRQIWEEARFNKAVLVAPPSVAFGLAAALEREFPVSTQILVASGNEIPLNWQDKKNGITILENNLALEEALQTMSPGDLLLGSSQEKKRLRELNKTQTAWQNISLPVYDELILKGRPLMGLNGATYLTATLWNQFMDLRLR
ncbi:MAG: nitrogenase component 1 [Sporomusaceae bacterium]|nr:nitrogenase component 1 [Sporomusaceae bacterium]